MNGIISYTKASALLTTAFKGGVDTGASDVGTLLSTLAFDNSAAGQTKVDIPFLTGVGRMKLQERGAPEERQRLSVGKLVVTRENYSLLLSFNEDEMTTNELAPYITIAQREGADATDFEDELASTTLTDGFANNHTDGSGKKFFDTGRPNAPTDSESGTYDNLIASALSATTYDEARTALFKMKDGKGNSLGLGKRGFTLVVAGNLDGTGRDIVKSANQAGGATNKWAGTADLEVWPWLPDDIAFLVAKSPSRRPLQKVRFSELITRMTDQNHAIANNGEVLWQALQRMAFTLLDPQCVIGINP